MKKQAGFTIVEIIVVIAVTGLFAALAGISLVNSRNRLHDTKRLADIKDIRSALELYFHDCNQYPTSITAGQPISGVEDCEGSVYLASVPYGPKKGEIYPYMPCTGYGPYDCGSEAQNPTYFNLGYVLQSNTTGISKGRHIATPDSLYQ